MNSTKYALILFILVVFPNKYGYCSLLGHLDGNPLKIYYLRAIQKGFSIQLGIKYEIK